MSLFLLFDDLTMAAALTFLTAELLYHIRYQTTHVPDGLFSATLHAFVRPTSGLSLVPLIGWKALFLMGVGLLMLGLVAIQLVWSALLVLVYGLVIMRRIATYTAVSESTPSSTKSAFKRT